MPPDISKLSLPSAFLSYILSLPSFLQYSLSSLLIFPSFPVVKFYITFILLLSRFTFNSFPVVSSFSSCVASFPSSYISSFLPFAILSFAVSRSSIYVSFVIILIYFIFSFSIPRLASVFSFPLCFSSCKQFISWLGIFSPSRLHLFLFALFFLFLNTSFDFLFSSDFLYLLFFRLLYILVPGLSFSLPFIPISFLFTFFSLFQYLVWLLVFFFSRSFFFYIIFHFLARHFPPPPFGFTHFPFIFFRSFPSPLRTAGEK